MLLNRKLLVTTLLELAIKEQKLYLTSFDLGQV